MDEKDPDVASIVIQGPGIRFVGIKEMLEGADLKHRRPKVAWWAPMKELVDTMAGRVNLEDVQRNQEGTESPA